MTTDHDEALLSRAFAFAQDKHAGQTDKCGKPYIDHVIRVGNWLLAAGCPKPVVAAGYLHDVVEDTDTSVADIDTEFGSTVGYLVNALSRRGDEPYWSYISRVRHSGIDAIKIKIADVLDNMDPERKPRPDEYGSMLSRYHRTLKVLTSDLVELNND